MSVDVTLSPSIYIYRWVNINATDTQGLPVSGAVVDAVTENPEEVTAFYYTPSGNQTIPASEVLRYLGKDATNYNVTDVEGKVSIPYLSEIMDARSPNSYTVYSYNLNLTYINSTGSTFVQPVYVSFYDLSTYHGYYPDLSADCMWLTTPVTIEHLVLDLPELYIISVAVPPTTLYVGDSVQVVAVVGNRGRTTALNVPINITGSVNGTTVAFETSQIIPSISYGQEVMVTATWSNLTYGTHTFSVYVNMEKVIAEEDGARDTNNEKSVQFVVLPDLADLEISSDGIIFSPQPAYTDSTVTATVTVMNTNGRASAEGVLVEIYSGSRTSGVLLASATINVFYHASADATLSFEPTQIGTYPLSVYVNGDRAIVEYSYDNNMAVKDITVGLNLVGPGLIIDGEEELALPTGPQTLKGNITVMDNGILLLDAVKLTIAQTEDNQFHIILMGSGQLILLNGSSIESGYKIELNAYDQSSMYVEDSSLSSKVSMVLRNDAEFGAESATIGSSLVANLTSSGAIVAYNTTFTGAWSLSGSTYAQVTSVSISGMSLYDAAHVDHFRWISIEVLDGNGYPIEGATVDVYHAFTGALYDSAISDSNGMVLIQGFCDSISASEEGIYATYDGGDYRPEAAYVYGGETYTSDPLSPEVDLRMAWYVPGQPIAKGDVSVVLSISEALPNLDPPISATPTQVYRGQVVEVWTSISNLGVVTAHNVVLKFNNSGVTFSTQVIEELLPGETVDVYAYWTAEYPLGNHVLSVMVDPDHQIAEMNENDNYNSTVVTVRGIAELSVSRSNVTFSPVMVSIGKNITIITNVYNSGDIPAENVTVKFYATAPGESEIYLGLQNITFINKGASGLASITWNPRVAGDYVLRITTEGVLENDYSNNNLTFVQNVLNYADLRLAYITFAPASPVPVNTNINIAATIINSGETAATNFVVRFTLDSSTGPVIAEVEVTALAPGATATVTGTWYSALGPDQIDQDWTIFVEANPDHLIEEITYSNNNASQGLNVYEVRPDLMFPTTISVTNSGSAVTGAAVGETITISSVVKNNGTSVAPGALIVFYAVDSSNKTFVIGSVTKTIGAGQSMAISYTWRVDAAMALGQASLAINANPNEAIIESNTSNDQVSINFLIDAPNLSVYIYDLGTKPLTPGTTTYVSGTVTNVNSTLGANHTLVTLFFMKDGVVVGQNFTVYTDSSGMFITGVYVPPTADGTYELHAVTSVGEKDQGYTSYVQIKQLNETGVPWWIYLLILVLVSAVIIGFSAYLYKYGLGKMVECGECGALIPESSKHCPKCGVEFEAGTAKCSECGAWIPSNSTSCPECGAKFITEAIVEEEDAYIKKMREQYESYVDIFREEAKKVLGKKYSDAKFPDWWKKQPSYISFESWVSQEEQKRKTGGQACPSCGTLNPRGATTCHKCGSNLEQLKALEGPASEKKDEEKPRPLRRIVRRPVEKKDAGKAPEDKPAEEAKPPEAN